MLNPFVYRPCVPRHRWFVPIDHLDDSDLEFVGWYKIADDGVFSLYQRPYDGEQQVVSNKSPRYLVVDDYNDAQALSRGSIIIGPQNGH